MDGLAIHLAFHGALILTLSILAGFMIYRAILRGTREAGWHLLHAGGTARGVMLIAFAAIIRLLTVDDLYLAWFAWLMIVFAWTSTLAMLIAAATDDRGHSFSGSIANRLTYTLYAVGTVAVIPACFLLIIALLIALPSAG
jgi:hypothetical protein